MNEDNTLVLSELMEATRRFNRQQMARRSLATTADLRPNEWHFLGHLRQADQGEGVKPSELAGTLGVTPGNVTQLITGLEKRGWISRRTDARDRRAVRVSLTEMGNQHMATMKASFTEGYAGLIEAMGSVE